MDTDTIEEVVEVVEGLIFTPKVIDECYIPTDDSQGWSEGYEQCPNCGFYNTLYLSGAGWYCRDCHLLWGWRLVR